MTVVGPSRVTWALAVVTAGTLAAYGCTAFSGDELASPAPNEAGPGDASDLDASVVSDPGNDLDAGVVEGGVPDAGRLVFITSRAFGGGFGGRGGGAERCNNLAREAGLSGEFVAWILDEDPRRLVRPDGGPYYRLDGQRVFDEAPAPQNMPPPLAPIVITERGETVLLGAGAWTGREALRCRGWSTGRSDEDGVVGNAHSTARWFDADRRSCGGEWRLYCFQK